MLLYTKGFRDEADRDEHFDKHGAECGAHDPVDYEEMADDFLGGDCPPGVEQRWRKDGDMLRYEWGSEKFGILAPDGHIRTYYTIDAAGHSYATNYEYFVAESKK